MKLNQRFIELAIQEAKKTNYRVKVGCVIFNKNKVQSVGHNDPLKAARKLHPNYQKWFGSVHAEVDAILHARTDLKGSSMLVIRINRLGQFRISKPCNDCMKYINKVGIKKIVYSIGSYPFFERI